MYKTSIALALALLVALATAQSACPISGLPSTVTVSLPSFFIPLTLSTPHNPSQTPTIPGNPIPHTLTHKPS